MSALQTAPYGGMRNGSHGEKEKGTESKAKDKMVKTEGDKLSRSVESGGDQDFGAKDELSDEWDKTAKLLRKTAETVLGVIFGKQKGDRETLWLNEEVQESIKEKKK